MEKLKAWTYSSLKGQGSFRRRTRV